MAAVITRSGGRSVVAQFAKLRGLRKWSKVALRGFGQSEGGGCSLFVVSCQLSVVSCQLSVVSGSCWGGHWAGQKSSSGVLANRKMVLATKRD
jgi:hypothetical protein